MSLQDLESALGKKREAQTRLQGGDLEAAKTLLIEACRLNPGDAESWLTLGTVNDRLNAPAEAETAYREALRLNADYGEAHQYLANLLVLLGRLTEATESYRRALRVKPHSIPANVNLGNVLVLQGRFAEALDSYQRALQIDPACRRASLGLAHLYERQGDPRQAYVHIQPYLDPDKIDADAAMIFAAMCRPLQRCDEAIALMEHLLAREKPPMDNKERIALHLRLGRLYDSQNRYDDAFRHFKDGNAIKARMWRFDVQAHIRRIDTLVATFNTAFMARAPRAATVSERPVFIVGMPRSGTSLVEQVLSSHPAVFGAGELEELTHIEARLPAILGGSSPYPECLTILTAAHCEQLARRYLDKLAELSPQALRITDKMPDNFLRLGLIALLFPGARIIHCLRDPIDTCLSCYFQNFGPGLAFAFDLAALAEYYRQYRRLMDHWRAVLNLSVLEVRYEDLVTNQEKVTRDLVAFCGLDWDERCLRFYESARAVSTASYDQVRQPLYTRSVERWRHYSRHLGPLADLVSGH
jgi:tetratricopeptide (TPR) repeat protein